MKVNFEVSAKAARLIGRENIADVDGALSELIKNAYDADASCAYVYFYVPFPDVPTRSSIDELSSLLSKADYKEVLTFYVPKDNVLYRKENLTEIEKYRLQTILFSYNRIIVADNGIGMNMNIINSSWMQIATDDKANNVITAKGRVKTGAKGIGRFALDKLSTKTTMYTRAEGHRTICWSLDWDQFSNTQLLKDVKAEIEETDVDLFTVLKREVEDKNLEALQEYGWETGTIIVLSPTRDPWSPRLFTKVNTNLKSINPLGNVDTFDVIVSNEFYPDFSYHTETVAIDKRDYDYKIHVEYDGETALNVEIERNEFDEKKQNAIFSVGDKEQQFPLSDFWNRAAFSKTPYRKTEYCNGVNKEHLNVGKVIQAQDFDKVRAVGPFSADLYFVKNGNSNFAFVKDIPVRHRKELLERFSGVKLYRDNFKVRPYGDEGSLYDWLDLNDRANRSPASVSHPSGSWRVLPYQLIGAVNISRLSNKALYDMANREGLTQNESYFYFVKMIQVAISKFEYDRQYIYREYDKWEKECQKLIAPATERIKEDVRDHGVIGGDDHGNDEQEKNSEGDNRFTEGEYREAVASLLMELDKDVRAKQTIEILSSSGVVLNTFFHEFNRFRTDFHTRSTQLRARIDYLLQGKPYSGIDFLDPYRKLQEIDNTDQILAGWLSVVMDAVRKEKFKPEYLSLWSETKNIIEIWEKILSEKSIVISLEPASLPDESSFCVNISVADLYVIINNFVLNSVYFFENGEQESRIITILFSEDDISIKMIMQNNGPCLDEKYISQPMQIFEIGESSKPDGEGTGLGLWLMRDAVERNDGQIGLVDVDEGFGIAIEWKKS